MIRVPVQVVNLKARVPDKTVTDQNLVKHTAVQMAERAVFAKKRVKSGNLVKVDLKSGNLVKCQRPTWTHKAAFDQGSSKFERPPLRDRHRTT